jgi:superfamily II helicase
MTNCSNCSDELKFSNKVIANKGNLNDGNIICRKCFKEISKIDIKFANSLKKYSLVQFKQALSGEGIEKDIDKKETTTETKTEQNPSEKEKMSGFQQFLTLIKIAVAIYMIYLGITLLTN